MYRVRMKPDAAASCKADDTPAGYWFTPPVFLSASISCTLARNQTDYTQQPFIRFVLLFLLLTNMLNQCFRRFTVNRKWRSDLSLKIGHCFFVMLIKRATATIISRTHNKRAHCVQNNTRLLFTQERMSVCKFSKTIRNRLTRLFTYTCQPSEI